MMKKVLSLILALCMVLALCACGKSSEKAKSEGTSSAAATPIPKSDAPEGYAYKSSFKVLSEGSKDYLNVLYYGNEGFYSSINEVVGQRELREGEEYTYDGQLDIMQAKLVYTSYADGKTTVLDAYVPLEAPLEGGEGQYEYQSNAYINGLTVTPEGDIYVIEVLYEYWFTEPDVSYDNPDYWNYYKYSQTYYLSKLNDKGEKISSTPITVSDEDYISKLVIDKDGNFLINGSEYIRGFDSEGNVSYEIPSGGYVDSINRMDDGTLYAMIWPDNGSQTLYKIDTDAKKLIECCKCPIDAYNVTSGGGDYPLYYNSGVTFFGLDAETGEAHKLFNWIDLDINGDNIARAMVLSDGRIVSTASTYDPDDNTFTVNLFTVEKVPADQIPVKQSLTLATQYLGYEAKNSIIEFNRRNDKYRIDVIDYSEYNTEEDYTAGTTKMKTEIMAGNVPDMIDLSSMPVTLFASKGILEDLYPYIDRDFNRSDYFENVLKACEVNGKLYTTIPGFSVSTLVGASSVVGDTPGWTYDEFNAALASMPEGCTALEKYTTRDQILNTCLGLDIQDFVNWETGEVNFNNEEFMDLLKFAKSFPETFDWENFDYSDEKSTAQRIASGEQMLEMVSVYSIDDIMYSGNDFGGIPTTYVGYPTNNGTGNMIYVDSGFAMTSACSDKEAAWSFLKIFFSEDYQKTIYNLPIIRSLFEKQLSKAMTPNYVKDKDGNIVVDENGEKKMAPRYTVQNAKGEWEDIYCLSEQQGNALRELVETTTKKASNDEAISSIVREEAAAFFSGQKSVEEIAKLIQSKANIYVNEQR